MLRTYTSAAHTFTYTIISSYSPDFKGFFKDCANSENCRPIIVHKSPELQFRTANNVNIAQSTGVSAPCLHGSRFVNTHNIAADFVGFYQHDYKDVRQVLYFRG